MSTGQSAVTLWDWGVKTGMVSFHLWINVWIRPNSITLSSSRASSRAGLRPASELDGVMEFGHNRLHAVDETAYNQSCNPVKLHYYLTGDNCTLSCICMTA